jgi:hypothetical protein
MTGRREPGPGPALDDCTCGHPKARHLAVPDNTRCIVQYCRCKAYESAAGTGVPVAPSRSLVMLVDHIPLVGIDGELHILEVLGADLFMLCSVKADRETPITFKTVRIPPDPSPLRPGLCPLCAATYLRNLTLALEDAHER